MSALCPEGPVGIPADFTAPTTRYRRHAWLASAGLVLFVAVYLALAGWFGWTAYRLFSALNNAQSEAFGNVLVGAGSAFLSIFMIKALFFVKRAAAGDDVEISPAEEPKLFEFLNRLADEIGAPRPHRVYVSGRVNAGVFYDLSVVNFLFASRKNLEIGLGLVNVLNLGEFRAVLAHEFGHFAQRTMAVGRWVYVAQQIAGHIVARRDAFDSFLKRLSRWDLRVAWVGWLLRLVVWAIRSAIDLVFRVVVLAQRALAREMEFQADLVSVSVSGSDALIHALHKLSAADDAWDRTLAFASNELRADRPVRDLFAVQLRFIEKTRAIFNDASYGSAPPIPAADAPSHRLFKTSLAAPPQMWSTHPSNSDREQNAKRRYIRAVIDERSAWWLFADAGTLRERISARLAPEHKVAPVAIEESLEVVDAQYSRAYFHPAFHGAYLGRSVVRHARTVDELYAPLDGSLLNELDSLYPEPLAQDMERLRELERESSLLAGLRAGFLTAPGGVIEHRGRRISSRSVPRAIEEVQGEITEVAKRLRDHDRRCRSAHLAAARAISTEWADYLRGLLSVHHYADHGEANLRDAQAALSNAVSVATAGGTVSERNRLKVIQAAEVEYAALKAVYGQASLLLLDAMLLQALGVDSWALSLGELKFPPPTTENIGDWLKNIDSWVGSAISHLSALRLASLEQLLLTETLVARHVREHAVISDSPSASRAPQSYPLLIPGTERPKQAQLDWWTRFQTASGVAPTLARVLVVVSIIGAAIWFGTSIGTSSIVIYNGLGRLVTVEVGKQAVNVRPYSAAQVDVGLSDRFHVRTITPNGHLVEEFDAKLPGGSSHIVYNVGAAGVLVAWTAAYGNASAPPPNVIGAPRWSESYAEVMFAQPPKSIQTKGGGGTRSVLTGLSGEDPGEVLGPVESKDDAVTHIIEQHARWDAGDTKYALQWISLALKFPGFHNVVASRLAMEPNESVNVRVEHALNGGAARSAACEHSLATATRDPTASELREIAAACLGAEHP